MLRHAEIFVVKLQIKGIPDAKLAGQFTFNNRTIGDPSTVQLVHLNTATASGGSCAANQNIALRQRIHLTVNALKRRHQQRTSTQAFGISHGRNHHIDGLPLTSKRRK
ncbi:Uncharacterised protein [Shigella sonnei]|nr:Uncharacterised protein [Shigella sonnei]CSR67026.1 Uncharacterised protein [Shigella sonnei]